MQNKWKYILLGTLTVAGCTTATIVGHTQRQITTPHTGPDYAKTSVMITDKSRQSGGTGNIYYSRPGLTQILTNKHICELVQTGGLVITDSGKSYPVEGYQVYTKHDLCMISIFKDLNVNIKLADSAPSAYSESVVVGHPRLLPTMITKGHFLQWREVSMMVGTQKCTGKEADPQEIATCIFYGMKPLIKTFSTQLTTSLIQPGSSGSAVYNEKGELSGVIFAGTDSLGYGYMVPWEYVYDFLAHLSKYPKQTPNPLKEPESLFATYFKFEKDCQRGVQAVSGLCSRLAKWGIWHE